MSLLVVTGGARSGKSTAAVRLVSRRGGEVVVAVAGASSDEEMRRRIEAHRRERRVGWSTLELGDDPLQDLSKVPDSACLLLDCLGSVVARIVSEEAIGDLEVASESAEERVRSRVSEVVEWLVRRRGDTVVVTNEVGGGVVPPYPDGRLFRDELGRANRRLVDVADGAWLVVAGRCLDLATQPVEPDWPTRNRRAEK
ncbi:MAG: bifunctional adenosylcobinamide kinase/adenosylcobinamide-phosphate guanylyltransferase [Coriobacteriia bacterium]